MRTPPLARLASLLAWLACPATSLGEDPRAMAEVPVPPAAAPARAAPGAPRLTVDLGTAAAVTGTELVLSGLSIVLKKHLVAPTCRWCEPPRLDNWARERLVWRNPGAAGTASDAFQLLVPAGAAAFLWVQAAPPGHREAVEDLVVLAEATGTSILLTQGAKFAVGRLRQDAWTRGTIESPDDKLSFWSGHASIAFAAASAATQIARLRGRPGWRWLGVAAFGGAALTAYLRVAANRHWLTDVASGAVVGTATGALVPLVAFRPADDRAPAIFLAPAPGGFALLF
jgi:membrane-associated phospholipid phosphatase